MQNRGVVVIGVALVAVQLCGWNVSATAGERRPELEAEIHAALVEKLGGDAEAIVVTVLGKKVSLTGMVRERSTQELAEEVALWVPGVKKVRNYLRAETDPGLRGGTVLHEADEARLESEIKGRLMAEIGRYGGRIEVEVAAGVASLRGSVPDNARREYALQAAAGVSGIDKVIDLIRVD